MPWEIAAKHKSCPPSKPFAVVKKGTGELVACHVTRDKAVGQMRALYANEGLVYDDVANEAIEPIIPSRRVRGEVTGTAAEAILFTADEQAGVPQAEIVIVRPGSSLNGRFYTQEAIRKAVATGFWNNSKMFLDHGDARMPMVRSIRDLVSGITDTWLGSEGEARGHVSFFSPEFAKFAQEAQKHIGVSISHEFSGRRFRDPVTHQIREQVDEFKRNHSVDWVAFPAAGGEVSKFFHASESEDNVANVDWAALDAEMLREHRPDLITEIGQEAIAAAADDPDDDGDDKPDDQPPAPPAKPKAAPVANAAPTPVDINKIVNEAVESRMTAIEQQREAEKATRAQVAAHLAKANLPAKTQARIAAQFDGQTEFVEASVNEAIEYAKEELKEAGAAMPGVFGAGPSGDGSAPSGDISQRFPAMAALNKAMGGPAADTTGKEN